MEAQALGFNVAKHKLAAFCVSALFSGLAGALLVFYESTASPGTVIDIAVGVQVIIAAVLGGRRTILGAVLGAVFLVGAGEVLRPLGQLSTFVVSAFALVVILFVPAGFLGTLLHRRDAHERQSPRRRLGGRSTRLLEVSGPDQALRRPGRGEGHGASRSSPARSWA